jgi:peptidoglycan/LPS O-acetylase OafA/YrhL
LGKLRGDVVSAVFYVANWFQIWSGQGYAAGADFVPLRHLWSLAVEEQFYLLWPLIMILILRRGREHLPKVGLYLIALSILITIATALLFHDGTYSNAAETPGAFFEIAGRSIEKNNFLYLGTISRSSGILLGAGFAMLWRPIAVMRGPLRNKGRVLDVWALLGLAGLAAVMAKYELFIDRAGKYFSLLFRGGLFLTGVCTLAVIAAVTHSGSLIGKFLGNKVLNWIGTRSYGLYLFHWPIYQMLRKQAGLALTVPKFVLALAITVVIAEGSYRYIEMPVRRRELFATFRSGGPRVMAALGIVGLLFGYSSVSLATAPVKCTSKIECDSQRASQERPADTTVPTVTTLPVSIPLSTLPGETSTTLAATTTTLPPREQIPYMAFGESVMQGALDALANAGVRVDAQESIQGKGMIANITSVLASADLTNAVIVQSGTNGPVTQEQYDQMATLLANVPHVYFMTVKAPKNWIEPNNAIIKALPLTHQNVQIIDWETQGKTIESQLSKADGGIHLNSGTAIRFYANLILAQVGLPTIPEPG